MKSGSYKNRQLTYKRANWVLGLTTSLKSKAALEADAEAVWTYTVTVILSSPSCTHPALLITLAHCQSMKPGPAVVSWIDFPKGSDQNSISIGRVRRQRPRQNRESTKVYHLQGPHELRKAGRLHIKYLYIYTNKHSSSQAWSQNSLASSLAGGIKQFLTDTR